MALVIFLASPLTYLTIGVYFARWDVRDCQKKEFPVGLGDAILDTFVWPIMMPEVIGDWLKVRKSSQKEFAPTRWLKQMYGV